MQIKRQSTGLGKGKSKRYLFYLAFFFIGHVQTTNIDKKKKSQILSSTNGRASRVSISIYITYLVALNAVFRLAYLTLSNPVCTDS